MPQVALTFVNVGQNSVEMCMHFSATVHVTHAVQDEQAGCLFYSSSTSVPSVNIDLLLALLHILKYEMTFILSSFLYRSAIIKSMHLAVRYLYIIRFYWPLIIYEIYIYIAA